MLAPPTQRGVDSNNGLFCRNPCVGNGVRIRDDTDGELLANSWEQPTGAPGAAQRAANTSVFPMPDAFRKKSGGQPESTSERASSSVFPMPANLFGTPTAAPGPAPTPAIVNPQPAPAPEIPAATIPGLPVDPDHPPVTDDQLPSIQTTSAAAAGGWILLTWLQTAGSCTLSVALHAMTLVTLASWTIFFPPEVEIIPTLASLGEERAGRLDGVGRH